MGTNQCRIFIMIANLCLWGKEIRRLIGLMVQEMEFFGRKIVYRSLRAITTGFNVNGTIGFIICINRDGIVDYTSLIENESTITNPKVRLAYLKASKEYKFEPDPTAPKQQCGKIKFTIDNSVKRSR